MNEGGSLAHLLLVELCAAQKAHLILICSKLLCRDGGQGQAELEWRCHHSPRPGLGGQFSIRQTSCPIRCLNTLVQAAASR